MFYRLRRLRRFRREAIYRKGHCSINRIACNHSEACILQPESTDRKDKSSLYFHTIPMKDKLKVIRQKDQLLTVKKTFQPAFPTE